MYIETRGSGPALVLIHGWAMHGGIFAPLVERLQSRYQLHLVDLPGHGRSRDDLSPLALASVAERIAAQIPRALWLGWSLGGLVALQAAQKLPTTVRGLIMLCASPRFVRDDSWPQGMDASVFESFANELARDYRGTLDRFLMLEAQGSDHVRTELRLLREQLFAHGEPATQVLCDGLDILQRSDLRAGLSSLAMPSLWIAGRRDRLVSPAAMQAAAAQAPHASFVEIQSGGHAPFLTHADEVVTALDAFVGRLPMDGDVALSTTRHTQARPA
jgi:pimeloyl-[acyl-carrier protein] methyl ester esterase